MFLGELLTKISYLRTINFSECEIFGISDDSKHIVSGDLFICFPGCEHDGHNYASEAVAAGAKAIICERPLEVSVPQIIVKDGRVSERETAAAYYGYPQRQLKIIGITGTNGKTTTSYMLASILRAYGKNCGIIGTLGIRYANKEIAPELTTPDPIFLYRTLADMVKSGVEYVVAEVSAHALYFGKTDEIQFEGVIFTNLTEDHLDFFKTMEKYAEAKEKLFLSGNYRFSVLNFDDAEGRKIAKFSKNIFSYALCNPSDVFAVDVREQMNGCDFVINVSDELYDIHINTAGIYNVSNAMAAAACAKRLGVPLSIIAEGLSSLKGVRGRMEYVARYHQADIFVDFAHTPDGLEKVLRALKKHCSGRLICMFGCGGNRDSFKRSVMGEAAAKNSDFCVLTSDNPRFEDPFDIILQIEEGVRRVHDEYIIIVDREKATEYALNMLRDGDILLIAGKGGEKFQEIMGVRHTYDDVSVVQKMIFEREKTEIQNGKD